MVVLVVDDFSIGTDESKGDSPVAANPYRPSPLSCALEGMKPQAGKAHVLGLYDCIEAAKDQTQSLGECGLNARLGPSLEKSGQPLMLEAPDHETQCNL